MRIDLNALSPILILVLVVLSTIFSCLQLAAQQVILQNYTMEDGLVANPVHHIYQDEKGFMWFSTSYGVSYYNGFRFVNYNKQNGLSSNWVTAVYEENSVPHLVLGNRQIAKVYPGRIEIDTLEVPVVIHRVKAVDEKGILATTSGHGIVRIDGRRVEQVTDPIEDYSVAFVQTTDGRYLLGGNYYMDGEYTTSLWLIDENGQPVTKAAPGDPAQVFQLFADSQDRIWIGTIDGLFLISAEALGRNELKPLVPPPPFDSPLLQGEVIDIIQDRYGNYWIGTTANGVVKIDAEGKLTQFSMQNGLASDKVLKLFEDREGNIWVGTLKGVSKIILGGHIEYYAEQDGLKDSDIQSVIARGENQVYVTTVNGHLQKVNAEHLDITTLATKEAGFFRFYPTSAGNTYVGYSTNRWFGKELYQFSETTGLGTKVITLPSAFFTVEEYDFNKVFIGSSVGLFVLDMETGTSHSIADINARVNHLLFDRAGNLWVSMYDGKLYKLEITYGSAEVIAKKTDMTGILEGGRARHCFEDSKGQIWVGTRNQGLVLISSGPDHRKVRGITQKDGLLSFSCEVTSEDRRGNLFVTSQLGVNKLIPQDDGEYKLFDFSAENRFYDEIWSVSRTDNDHLWLATSSGLVRIKDYNTDTLSPPPVYITRIVNQINEEIIQRGNTAFTYDHNSVQFDFSSPSFINEHALKYSYRLIGGADNSWSEPANAHRVAYADLRPGNYRFEVRSVRDISSTGPADTYDFTIRPPWWRTWWFYTLLMVLAAALVVYFVRRRIRQIRFKADMNQQIVEMKMMALRAQMNPHFIFNCINNIDALVQNNEGYEATKYLNKFAKLLRNVLDSSNMTLVPLKKDLDTLRLYMDLEQLRDKGKYSISMQVDDALYHKDYTIPPLIVQPYVENAILHGLRKKEGNDGKLTITVAEEYPYLKYVIEDNGVGRQFAQEHRQEGKRSYGMQMSYDRVKHFNNEDKASIEIIDLNCDGTPCGTRVEVLLMVE